MSHAQQDQRSGVWVGSLSLGTGIEFLRLTVAVDGAATIDRPDRMEFQVPLSAGADDRRGTTFTTAQLSFAGSFRGEHCAGSVDDGTTAGSFELWRVKPVAAEAYGCLMGHYRLDAAREIMLSRTDIDDDTIYFYGDANRLVRIYPLGPDRFFSERCETLSFQLNGQGAATCLVWGAPHIPPVEAPRMDRWREEAVRIPVNDYVLAGTLLLPPGAGPHPAVMLCHGASTHCRDFYRVWAEPFVERGIAAFVYDKRGRGESTGTPLWSELFDLADDACAIFRFLQTHPALQANAIGIWGFSNGAWVAPLTASRMGDAAFVIGASAAGVTPARQEQIRRANVAAELGASPRAVALISRLWEQLFRFEIDGRWNGDVEAILQQVYADDELQRLPRHPDHGPGLQPVPPQVPIEQIRAQEGGTWKEGGFDPAPAFAGLACPILCVWGAHDDVIPLDESRERLATALQDRPRHELHVVPDATHSLFLDATAPAGMLTESMHRQLHHVVIAPGVRALMANWARRTPAVVDGLD